MNLDTLEKLADAAIRVEFAHPFGVSEVYPATIKALIALVRMQHLALATLNSVLFNNDDDYPETRQHIAACDALAAYERFEKGE